MPAINAITSRIFNSASPEAVFSKCETNERTLVDSPRAGTAACEAHAIPSSENALGETTVREAIADASSKTTAGGNVSRETYVSEDESARKGASTGKSENARKGAGASSGKYAGAGEKRGIDSFTLKIAAIVGMACNHLANVFAAQMPDALTIGTYTLGGLTFPIMAFLLVVGFTHTSNIKKYATRLLAFAIISQVPYSLLWGPVPNVLFTLLLGLGVLYFSERLSKTAPVRFAIILVAAVIVSTPFDWGGVGIVMIYLLYILRDKKNGVWTAMLVPIAVLGLPTLMLLPAVLQDPSMVIVTSGAANTIAQAGATVMTFGELGYSFIGFTVAAALISQYNGLRGRPLKYFFYAFYPAHLFVIWLIAQLI